MKPRPIVLSAMPGGIFLMLAAVKGSKGVKSSFDLFAGTGRLVSCHGVFTMS